MEFRISPESFPQTAKKHPSGCFFHICMYAHKVLDYLPLKHALHPLLGSRGGIYPAVDVFHLVASDKIGEP